MLREGTQEHLPQDAQNYIQTLESEVTSLTDNLSHVEKKWSTKYDRLVDEYRLLLYKRFGRSSEKIDVTQGLLFDEGNQSTPTNQMSEESSITITEHTRTKRECKPLDPKIPREEIIHDIPEEEKQCACGAELMRIGEAVAERLQVIPEQIYVEKHIRPKYACRNCEGSGDEDKPAVRIAPAVPSIIPKSIVTPGLLAFFLVNKYVDHLLFYRQEKRFERIGIQISRQDMSFWQQKVFEALHPLFDLLRDHLRTGPVIQMDETPVQVMKEPDRPDTLKSYMWLVRGPKHITELLAGFSGYIQTDGYEAYKTALNGRNEIIHVGCFAHASRKFVEASKGTKKAGSAQEGLKRIQKLYTIERELRARELQNDEFRVQRKQQVEPMLDDLKSWLQKKAGQVPPQTLIGKAVYYTLGQ